MSERIYDAAVIGAGPAGAAAARAVASAGLAVIILEKAIPPRYKTCGGGILARTARSLGGLPPNIVENACHSVQFSLTSQLQFVVSRPTPIVYMTMRSAFDDWLIKQALVDGARLEPDCLVSELSPEECAIRLTTSRGVIRARYVIAADGAGSPTARLMRWPGHARVAPAVECEVKVGANDFARLSQMARFDFDVLPQGYAWVFPKKSHLSIGVLSLKPGVNLHRAFDQYLARLGISEPLSIHRHGYVIPIASRHHTLARGRIFLTGDAAGLADPVTAEGITAALHSGRLAGESIGRHISSGSRACAAYNLSIHRQIIPGLRWAGRLAFLLYKMPQIRDALFAMRGQGLAEAMTKIVTGDSTYGSLITNPSNYARLLLPEK